MHDKISLQAFDLLETFVFKIALDKSPKGAIWSFDAMALAIRV